MAALSLLALSPVGAQPPVPHDVVFLIDNSPSVRTGDTDGDGKPDTTPTDEQDVRLRMARFVVNVLGLDLTSGHQRVGAISFTRSKPPLTLMTMTPVQDWSKADFAAIREEIQGNGTDFAAAINAASDMLFPTGDSSCSPNVRRCDIVMVTDGSFHNTGQDRDVVISQAEEALLDLPSGVSVHILTFEADDRTVWQGFLAEKLISTYQPSVTVNSPGQVYSTVLGNLGAEALLEGLIPVALDGEKSVTLNVLPFRTWMRYQILADAPLTVTFFNANQVVTPVVAGTEYTFFQPQAGKWNVRFQGDGLAYYRQAGEGMADLALYLRAPYGTMPLGSDVPIEVGITAGGAPITDTQHFTVTAIITSPGLTIDPMVLTRSLDFESFSTSISSDLFVAGMYTLTLMAESSITNTSVHPIVGKSFTVAALPTLSMLVEPTDPVTPGTSVYVTMMVSDWRRGHQLILHRLSKDEAEVMVFTQPGGIYSTVITSVLSETVLLAELNYEIGNRRYLTHTALHPIVVASVQPVTLPIFSQILIPLGVFLLVGIMALLCVLTKRSKSESLLDDKEQLRRLGKRAILTNWAQIEQAGKELASEWRSKHWKLYVDDISSQSALQAVLTTHAAMADCLKEGNQFAIAVLVYAGVLASCTLGYYIDKEASKAEHDPISPWTVLEGYPLKDFGLKDFSKRYAYTVGDCLRSPNSWHIFQVVWQKFEGNKNLTSRFVEDWSLYAQLVKSVLGKHDGSNASSQDKDKLNQVLEKIKTRLDKESSLYHLMEDILNQSTEEKDFKSHPVLWKLTL